MAGDVQGFWPAISSVLSGVSGGAKLGCVAHPFNKISRELIVRKEIESLSALRDKIVGVQSIGGGFWLQTMIVLDRLGMDPDKNKLQMRIIGDEPTILQALLASNIDAAVITFASAAVAKRAGLRSLANTAELKVPYQGVGICTRSDRITNAPDLMMRLVKGMIEGVVAPGYGFYPRNVNGPDFWQFYVAFGGQMFDPKSAKLVFETRPR
jgi:ABC-type nitrate/sulfonate/bicarbonate transport system substrate-binding protein